MLDPSRVQVRGPLEVFAAGFAVELRACRLSARAGRLPVAVDGARESLA